MMLRLAAILVLVVLVALPLAAWPAAPVTWLAGAALVVGGAGVVALAVSLTTVAAVLALLAYTVALVTARPTAEPVTAMVLGAALVLLLALVHLGHRVRAAVVEPAVIARQARDWLIVVALGLVAAAAGAWGGAALRPMLAALALPMVVIVAALGAVLTMLGVSALVVTRGAPPAPADNTHAQGRTN
jgi:hypothetical protein